MSMIPCAVCGGYGNHRFQGKLRKCYLCRGKGSYDDVINISQPHVENLPENKHENIVASVTMSPDAPEETKAAIREMIQLAYQNMPDKKEEQKADIEQEATIEFNLLPESEDTFKEGYTVATKKYTASLKQKDEDISALDKVIIGHESTICDKDEEIARLEQWKREAIEVDFDRQEVGRLLQIPLGQSIHDKIIPGIKRLQQEVERLNKQLNAKNIECDKLKERLSASQFAHGKCLTQLSQSFTVEEISKAYEEWEFNDSIDIPFTEYLTNLKDKKEGKV